MSIVIQGIIQSILRDHGQASARTINQEFLEHHPGLYYWCYLSPASIGSHLRSLNRAGLIERAEPRVEDGRVRITWRLTTQETKR